jgi:hypothetical protein
MFLPFLVGYGLAVRQCRAELMATQSWLQEEVAELRKELAAMSASLRKRTNSGGLVMSAFKRT